MAQDSTVQRLVVTPLSLHLDVGATGSVYTTAYNDQGKTIFVVTHQAPLMESVADEFVHMSAGKIDSREEVSRSSISIDPALRTRS